MAEVRIAAQQVGRFISQQSRGRPDAQPAHLSMHCSKASGTLGTGGLSSAWRCLAPGSF